MERDGRRDALSGTSAGVCLSVAYQEIAKLGYSSCLPQASPKPRHVAELSVL